MDGSQPGACALPSPVVVLQSAPLDRPVPLRPLYWRVLDQAAPGAPAPEIDAEGCLRIPPGLRVSFDTYFGAVFEYHWRMYTGLRSLGLRLDLDGAGRVRIWRRVPDCADELLHDQVVTGPAEITLDAIPAHFRQAGLVWFDIAAAGEAVQLRAAQWLTRDSLFVPVGLGVAICTFDRPAPLAAVLEGIAGNAGGVARVIVVNQGRRDLWAAPPIARAAARLGPRLRGVDQANFGGAGGFGRGIIEALDDPAVTHVCLLDDDVMLEPDCLLRMASFFALADRDVAVGGHMLDLVQPTTLYEAGATIRPDWTLRPHHHHVDLTEPGALETLLDTNAIHYNGWWMFGFPKRLVASLGMPLPCFLRGDDVEFGLRLHRAGVFTVPLPGVAIWHEPFYLKLGGWQLYYETRNALLCAALHEDFSPGGVALRMIKRLLVQALTYRYYSTALIIRAIEDVLDGPGFLQGDPGPRHASLSALRAAHAQAWTPREQVLMPARVAGAPRWRIGFVLRLGVRIAHDWLRPEAADAAPRAMEVRDHVWFRVADDALAVDTHWDAMLPTYRRDRATFRALFHAGARAVFRLYRDAPGLRGRMRQASAEAATVSAWRGYLGLAAGRDAGRAPADAEGSVVSSVGGPVTPG